MMNQEMIEKRKSELEAEAKTLMEQIKLLKTELGKVESAIEEIEKNFPKLRKLDGKTFVGAKPCAIVAPTPNLTGSKAITPLFDVTGKEAESKYFLEHSIKKISDVEMKFVKESLAKSVPDFNYGKTSTQKRGKNVFSGGTGIPLKINTTNMGIKFAVRINAIVFGAPLPNKSIIHQIKKWFNN